MTEHNPLINDAFLQPLRDLLHATSLDERRCILCRIPFSPVSSGAAHSPISPEDTPLPLCPACRLLLQPRTHGHCPTCGNLHELADSPLSRCGECLQSPPPWEHFRFYGIYSGALKTLLLRGKFGADPGLLNLLGRFLVHVCQDLPVPDALIPVPLHRSRLRERGFNQSLELARPLSQFFGVPLKPNWLIRTMPTPHQIGLSREERRANLKRAFKAFSDVQNKRILLVDDTFTTGTTLRRCTQALLDAGALAVDAAVVARAPKAQLVHAGM